MDFVSFTGNETTLYILCFTLAFISIILLVLVIFSMLEISKLKRKYKSFMQEASRGETIEELLHSFINETRNYSTTQSTTEKRLNVLENQISKCFQKYGIVRYNPFDDTGGDLSYVVALLDNTNSGFVLSGLFNRDGSHTYAKQIDSGVTKKHKLSQEEQEALQIALDKK